ncbi:ras-related protein Rab-32-like [Limulus polyphemus]|uniref:Ras-related protein Rab n=1 Tax=Limulus polyphemus TaxID=6850 RepID=A0ABM1B030_LIMPO|nr:ras-related protein Rab-32-like [Limulus polyphemus]
MTAVVPFRGENNTLENSITNYETEELLFKVLVIGDFGVGKTAIIRRYTEGVFSQYYKITIGVDFAIKSILWDAKTRITLQLWDIAGHERFGYMTRVYYKYATAAIIVYDLSRLTTLESVVKWQKDVIDKVTLQNGQPIPIILLANKCDIEGISINCEMLTEFCKQHNILAWFFTSAKENIHIDEAIEYLVENIIYQRSDFNHPKGHNHISLTHKPNYKKVKCCGT